MAILSVDLACRRWADLGVAVLERVEEGGPAVRCELMEWGESDLVDPVELTPQILAGRLNHLANTRGIKTILLDGPQAWKSSRNGLKYARTSESQLNTAAKTGLPGQVKPSTYRNFAEFCVDVYAELCLRGWRRLDTRGRPGQPEERILVESYPYAAWRSLGLKPLPSKRRARVSDLAEAYDNLQSIVSFTVNRPPNHDQLQAIVGGLAGLALEAHGGDGARIVGAPPRREEGQWREGFIVLPLPPRRAGGLRWLESWAEPGIGRK
jgi:hypothetical protein